MSKFHLVFSMTLLAVAVDPAPVAAFTAGEGTTVRDLCIACHGADFADAHFFQFETAIQLYNEKFARPAQALRAHLDAVQLEHGGNALETTPAWSEWDLWHQANRGARHGDPESAPNQAWWHGFEDEVRRFYFEFLPAVEALGDEALDAKLAAEVHADPVHAWLSEANDAQASRNDRALFHQRFTRIFDEYLDALEAARSR